MIKELFRIIEHDEPISFFLGAGVSLGPADGPRKGLGTGGDLARHLIKVFSLTDAENLPLMSICDECSFINESQFRKELKTYLENAHPQETHTLLTDIISIKNEPKDFLLTVNVDDLLETEFRQKKGKPLSVAKKSKDIYIGGDKTYLKIHGCVSDIEDAVFTTKDYLNLDKENRIYEKIAPIFAERSIVFIGFSLQDIDILRILYSICPQGGFPKPHFWIVPRGANWSDARSAFYLRQFNIRHIDMKAERFLADALECLQKKKARDSLIDDLRNSHSTSPISIKRVEALIEIVNDLSPELQVNLLRQCLISKDSLQEKFFTSLATPARCLQIISELLAECPEMANLINVNSIELKSASFQSLRPILSELAQFEIKNFIKLLLSLNAETDPDWVLLVFKLLEDTSNWARVMEIFHKVLEHALFGLMQNRNINVLYTVQKYYKIKDDQVYKLLSMRIDQLNGKLLDFKEINSRQYDMASEVLKAQDSILRTKYGSVWINIKCDEGNTCRTRFFISPKLDLYKEIFMGNNEVERAIIGTGLVVLKKKEKTSLHLIVQDIEIDLDVGMTDYISIAQDKVLCFEGNILYVYNFLGELTKVEMLAQPAAIAPKVKTDGKVYYVGLDNTLYSIDTNLQVNPVSNFGTTDTVIDFVLCEESFAIAAGQKIYLLNQGKITVYDCNEDILGLVSDHSSIYSITNSGISAYKIDEFTDKKKYDIIADVNTSVIVPMDGVLVFGHKNRIVSVNFNDYKVNHSSITIDKEEMLLDLIYCDNQVVAIGRSGLLYFIDFSEPRYVFETIPASFNRALLSAGSGVVCIRTEHSLLLCRNIA